LTKIATPEQMNPDRKKSKGAGVALLCSGVGVGVP